MSQWREIKLKDLCDKVTVGYVSPMAQQYVDSGVTFLRSMNIKPFRIDLEGVKFVSEEFHQKIRKSALRPRDVAVVRTGYPGTAAVVPESLHVSNCSDLVIVRPGENLNPHFITAIFNSTFGQTLVSGNTVGAAQQHFNITVAKELRFRVPPKAIQDKIAAILSAYDELIETNQRRIALLGKLAEEIYREWFVRLRFPGHEQVKKIKGVPVGWETSGIFEVASVRYGKNLPTKLLSDDLPYPVYGAAKIIGAYSEYNYPERTIITGCRGSVGQISITKPFAFVTNNSFAIIPHHHMSFFWLFQTLRQRGLADVVGGSAQPQITIDGIRAAKMLVPPEGLRAAFNEIIAPTHEMIWGLEASNTHLTRTRDLLLPRLISGKLSVEDLEIAFPPGMECP